MRVKLTRFIVLVSLFVAMLSFSACSKIDEMKETAESMKSDVEEEVAVAAEDVEEIVQDIESDAVQLEGSDEESLLEEAQEASDETPTVEWPTDIPAEVPQITGVNITAVVPLGTESTIMFESDDMDAVKNYVGELEKAGFVQSSFDENKFGLNYYGEKDSIKLFINFVTSDVSKLNIAY